jgi:hypothetical protein
VQRPLTSPDAAGVVMTAFPTALHWSSRFTAIESVLDGSESGPRVLRGPADVRG